MFDLLKSRFLSFSQFVNSYGSVKKDEESTRIMAAKKENMALLLKAEIDGIIDQFYGGHSQFVMEISLETDKDSMFLKALIPSKVTSYLLEEHVSSSLHCANKLSFIIKCLDKVYSIESIQGLKFIEKLSFCSNRIKNLLEFHGIYSGEFRLELVIEGDSFLDMTSDLYLKDNNSYIL